MDGERNVKEPHLSRPWRLVRIYAGSDAGKVAGQLSPCLMAEMNVQRDATAIQTLRSLLDNRIEHLHATSSFATSIFTTPAPPKASSITLTRSSPDLAETT